MGENAIVGTFHAFFREQVETTEPIKASDEAWTVMFFCIIATSFASPRWYVCLPLHALQGKIILLKSVGEQERTTPELLIRDTARQPHLHSTPLHSSSC